MSSIPTPSQTPRTDALTFDGKYRTMLEHARQLEVELECAREALIQNQQELNRVRYSPSSESEPLVRSYEDATHWYEQCLAAQREAEAKQAEIDRLMLEYCPDEMTAEQKANWAEHQIARSDGKDHG